MTVRNRCLGGGSRLPTYLCQSRYSVSWDDVQDFIRRLNARAGETRCGLPTEAEWENAAGAGTREDRYAVNLDAIAWYDEGSHSRLHPVGEKEPNGWGLHDMLRSVIERV